MRGRERRAGRGRRVGRRRGGEGKEGERTTLHTPSRKFLATPLVIADD